MVLNLQAEVQVFMSCCKSVLNDDDFCADEDRDKMSKDTIQKILTKCSVEDSHTFIKWLHKSMHKVLHESLSGKKVNQEKLWTEFHELRGGDDFKVKWEDFLNECNISPVEPHLYQHLSVSMFKMMISTFLPTTVPGAATSSESSELTYEEMNALRYIGGYIIRSIRKDGMSRFDFLIKREPCSERSEEWLSYVDRGGLIHITDNFFQTLCSMELVIREELHGNSTFDKIFLLDRIMDNSDVLFNWTLTISEVDMEVEEQILFLENVIKKLLTIRGFSFAASILETYKQDNKKSTEKSLPLRKKLSSDKK